MASKHMKRCSASLSIREMQIKTTVRYHLTPVRMAVVKRTIHDKNWQQCGGNGTLVPCRGGCKVVQLPRKTGWRFLKQLKIELLWDPVILHLGVYLKNTEKLLQTDTWPPQQYLR